VFWLSLCRAPYFSGFRGSFLKLKPILRVFEFLTKLPSSIHLDTFLRQNGTELKSRLVQFQSGTKKHAECRLIGIGTVSIIATLIIPQPANQSYPSYGPKVNKNGGSSNCTKGKKMCII